MDITKLNEHALHLLQSIDSVMHEATQLDVLSKKIARASGSAAQDPFILGLTVFILACFIGYYVIWKVTPALHSPLMAVTNAISSVIIVGAVMSMGKGASLCSLCFGFIAILLASINIFGGFVVTQRMLSMFSKISKKR